MNRSRRIGWATGSVRCGKPSRHAALGTEPLAPQVGYGLRRPRDAGEQIRLRGTQTFTPEQVRLLAPIVPSKVVAVAKNYRAHAREMGGEPPAEPMIFLKPSSSVIGPGEPIRLPAISERVTWSCSKRTA